MSCDVNELRHVPLFSLLDDDELAVLSSQVELREFAANQRIYKAGELSEKAYVAIEGAVKVVLLDEDGREVIFSEPRHGDMFGFASMLEHVAHQTSAYATQPAKCLEVDRADLQALIEKKPMAGIDMLTVLAREIHSAQHIVRERTARNANELFEEDETFGERIADRVASFGGSWTFIIFFLVGMVVYTIVNISLRRRAWDPYPFILLNLILSMLAAIQAPVIMMSQNRQDAKDRVRSELDFDVNKRAEAEIKDLGRRLNTVLDRVGDLDENVRALLDERKHEPAQN